MEILKDTKFENGFGVMGGVNGDREVTYDIYKELNMPNQTQKFSWRIAQWATRHALQNELDVINSNEFISFENISKQIIVDKKTRKLSLNAMTSNEYEKPRNASDPWVHLLIEQVFEEKQKIPFKNMKELNMSMEFSVNKCEDKMPQKNYDKNIYAAQAVWYITVENSKSKEISPEGRPDYFWFGIPVFDNRGLNKETNYHLDFNTKKLIYSMGAENFYNPYSTVVGNEYKFNYNVLSEIKKAFDLAKENDFLPGAEFDDMVIGSMNAGWEIPGIFDVNLDIKKISINYKG